MVYLPEINSHLLLMLIQMETTLMKQLLIGKLSMLSSRVRMVTRVKVVMVTDTIMQGMSMPIQIVTMAIQSLHFSLMQIHSIYLYSS